MGIGFADYGIERAITTPFVISPINCIGALPGVTLGDTTWPTANLALFVPFVLSEQITFNVLRILIGGVTSGNVDVGIYDINGKRVVSTGSQAAGLASQGQAFAITGTVVYPGRYFLALAVDNTTLQMRILAFNDFMVGMQKMLAAFPLPATVTYDGGVQIAYIPLVGVSVY
jgi:hypothetical protein